MRQTRWTVAAVTWLLLAVLYCVLAGEVSIEELVAASAAAAAATITSVMARHLAGRQFRFLGIDWWHEVARTARDIAAGMAKVALASCLRLPPSGGFIRKQVLLPAGESERAGLLGVRTLSTSISPNAFVIWELAAHQELLVHCLGEQDDHS